MCSIDTGKLNDQAVNRFAVRGEYVNVVAALALKADASGYRKRSR